ncbi:hypothetical protein H6F39_06805 [Anabaena sp. FACHB-1250]|uniref:Uncharacterized protein n=1 Tax=Dolichospermum planctonicum TaxID=136072 RepID=A0A480AAA2_9CYAN|nr:MULTISPECIES: hypothetical protein [Nostocales]MBD2141099.1 hypothetical protein [Anabaena sp. FACHB-1250]MBD2267640.1 hypothetical protein [Anabaena sp. FACHB-1391]GCL41432.1 hypothetical protein NIES80_11270 [Dolichospermum planctonicum]
MAYRDFKLPELVKKFGLTINKRKEGNKINLINGIVTTGNMWKFLQLQDQVVYIDFNEYYIKDIKKILGILSKAVN